MDIKCLANADSGISDIFIKNTTYVKLLQANIHGLPLLVDYKITEEVEGETVVTKFENAPCIVKCLYYTVDSGAIAMGVEVTNVETEDVFLLQVFNVNNEIPIPIDPSAKPLFTGTYLWYDSDGVLQKQIEFVDKKFAVDEETANGTIVIYNGVGVIQILPTTAGE